jgi:hypothetical protein
MMGYPYRADKEVGPLTGFDPEYEEDLDWFEEQPDTAGLADVLRHSLRYEYADVSDEDMDEALANVLDSMSPAESLSFAGALREIGQGASQLLSDPTIGQIARTALPIAGGSLGTAIGGPVGTALGSKLGAAAASALPARAPSQPPVAPVAVVPQVGPVPGVPPTAAPAVAAPGVPPTAAPAVPASPVADGSVAAARALVLARHPGVLQSLLAAAMGQYGQTHINGVPVARMLGMLSEAADEAAADADELMYLRQAEHTDNDEGVTDAMASGSDRSLYARLLEADNAELAEAIELEGLDAW